MTLSSGAKVVLAAFAVAGPTSQCFLAQKPMIHGNAIGRHAADTSSKCDVITYVAMC